MRIAVMGSGGIGGYFALEAATMAVTRCPTAGVHPLSSRARFIPAAVVGALYYGLAGAGHLIRPERNSIEEIALVSDLLDCMLLGVFLAIQSIS